MKIGVYGGTFDPPHIGHLILAIEAADQLGLEKVLWVLTPQPPHKPEKNINALEQRAELVKAVVGLDKKFEFSSIEIERPGPHYSVDTMRLLNAIYPQDEIYYLIGGDSLVNMIKWYQPQELVRITHKFGVMQRPGYPVDLSQVTRDLPGIADKLAFIDTPLLEISSTDIRQRIAAGRPFQYFLPQPVYKLIKRNHYYRSPGV